MQTGNLSPSSAFKLQQYSCKKCKCWFRNRSGLTQHTHAKHPRFSPPPALCIPDEQSVPRDNENLWAEVPTGEVLDDPMDGSYTISEHSDGGIPAAFVGPDDALFRNYHPSLTGEKHTDICLFYQEPIVFTTFSSAMRLRWQFFAKWNPTRTTPGEVQG